MPQKMNYLKSTAAIGKGVTKFYADLHDAPKRGKMVCWFAAAHWIMPILRSMDVVPFFTEPYCATVAGRRKHGKLQQIALDKGYSEEICSYMTTGIGAALITEEEGGGDPELLIPKPDFVVNIEGHCSTLTQSMEMCRRHFNVPMFHRDIPHLWEGTEAEEKEAIAESVKVAREFISFAEDMTHKHFDPERFLQVAMYAKEACTLRVECMELNRAIPAPASHLDHCVALGAFNLGLGEKWSADVYGAMKEEIQGRISRKEGALTDEKYRIYWEGIPIWPKIGELSRKFAALDMVPVCGRYPRLVFIPEPERIDPRDPLEGLVANMVIIHANHNYDWLINKVTRMCKDFAIDGMVIHSMRTCRPLSGPGPEVLNTVTQKLGIPTVIIEADMSLDSFYSEAQIDTRLQALAEAMAAKKMR